MQRPSRVRVGPHTLQIEYLSHKKWTKRGLPGDKVGQFSLHTMNIFIATSDLQDEYSEGYMREVLMHEILHAVWEVGGLTSALEVAIPDSAAALDEQVVGQMSPVILGVLLDNPDVLAYLLAVD